jgi:hypothetical protein
VAVFDLQGGKVNDCSHCCSWVLRIVKIQHLLMSFSMMMMMMMMMMMILIYVQGEPVKLTARDLPKGIGTC